MFFVNSRPCALPQVSKAVNEVYKSYNVTQSPFIFANLVMDTGAYDVNVSPDKRTILLHDQTALLEALKAALIQLFEDHDQTVPHAQLGVKKFPQFSPLNLARQSSTSRDSDGADGPIAQSEDGEGSDPKSSAPSAREKGDGSPSLIQQFIGRDATSRSQLPMQPPARRKSGEASKDKQKLARFLAKGAEGDDDEPPEKEEDAMQVDSSSPPPTPAVPQAVQDFNDRIASQQAKSGHQGLQDPSSDAADEEPQEQGIAAVNTSSQKNAPGPVQNAFDRMRPKRAPAETATITIGNKTTTMTIGTPEAKRRRIHTPKHDLKGNLLLSPKKNSGFVSSLKLFTAPGTQVSEGDDDIEDDLDGSGEGDQDGARSVDERDEEPDSSAPQDTQDASNDIEMVESGDDTSDNDAQEDPAEPSKNDGNLELPRAESPLFVQQDEESDGEYLNEDEKKAREEARVAEIIAKAEETVTRPTQDNLKRATNILKGGMKKTSTLQLIQNLETTVSEIEQSFSLLNEQLQACAETPDENGDLLSTKTDQTPEERLSLTVSKSDFGRMRTIGQFNLGFILAVRPASDPSETAPSTTSTLTPSTISHADELFIIDQHASDEKINFERLSNTTILAPQRLVHPHTLDLTAIEEEIILSHPSAFAANGFQLTTDTSGDTPVGQRCQLLGLPVSRETTFTVSDLEELVALLGETSLAPDHQRSSIPRPGKVRKMLAMRACRSSIMIGKNLTTRQMEKVVREMGAIDKPWNCPHGRPTMRHLASLGQWEGWGEGEGVVGLGEVGRAGKTDWKGFMEGKRGGGV